MQTNETGVQLYSDTSPYKVSEQHPNDVQRFFTY